MREELVETLCPAKLRRVLCSASLMVLLTWVTWLLLGRSLPLRAPAMKAEVMMTEYGTVVTSTVSRGCLEVIANRKTVQFTEERLLLLYEGTPQAAYLVVSSCGVKAGKHHTIYLNGQAVAELEDDSYRTCRCDGAVRPITYTLAQPLAVRKGWNHISLTNDADIMDSWIAYDAKLLITGEVTGAVKTDFTFVSSYDGSTRRAAYKVPVGYRPDARVPLLVSIGGTGEDRWDALYHYAERTNAVGWLLMAPEVRSVNKAWGGRTASLATQHDVMDAIDYMLTHFSIDADRIYMSGFSAGGGVAATIAAKYPHVFAAVVDWIGPTDLHAWARQRPQLYEGMVVNDFGCPPDGESGACPFEWERRSARKLVMNLKHVPMAIVHGRADEVVPFVQSEQFYTAMSELYDPTAHNKVAVWHDGGHLDAVPALRPLEFLQRFTLNAVPEDVMVRTDESKEYYWIHVQQRDWNGKTSEGFSNVIASYDRLAEAISVTVWDEREFEGGNLPVEVSIDLRRIGFDPDDTYAIEDYNLAAETRTSYERVPLDGHLRLTVPRDVLGKVYHRYSIQLRPSREER